jgi:glycosyltransferase involved in cell wall biosynthesis
MNLASPGVSALRGMRICLLTGTLGQGGAERQLFYIASALKSAEAQVQVLSLTSGEMWESRLQAIGVPVKFVGASASRLVRLFAITKAVRDFRPAIVQSQHFYTNAYSGLAARVCGARAIGAVRGNGFSDLRTSGRGFGKPSLYLPHKLVANSRAAIRNLISLNCPREKLDFLPNVIDLNRFSPTVSTNGNPLTILGIGRFTAEKRFDRFLHVIAALQQACHVPCKALIAGSGPLRAELEKLARECNLRPGTVEFCGDVSEVESLYKKSSLFLLTSDHEGTPNVVMEAMASSLPVVATAVGDVPALVEHGLSGYVVGITEVGDAVRYLVELIQDSSKRESMGSRARAFIKRHHDLASLPDYLARLYSFDSA